LWGGGKSGRMRGYGKKVHERGRKACYPEEAKEGLRKGEVESIGKKKKNERHPEER